MLKKIVLDSQIYKYNPIDTSNLDTTGQNKKIREDNEKKEFELLKKNAKNLNYKKKMRRK